MVDGVFPQRADDLLVGVVEFDPADVLGGIWVTSL